MFAVYVLYHGDTEPTVMVHRSWDLRWMRTLAEAYCKMDNVVNAWAARCR